MGGRNAQRKGGPGREWDRTDPRYVPEYSPDQSKMSPSDTVVVIGAFLARTASHAFNSDGFGVRRLRLSLRFESAGSDIRSSFSFSDSNRAQGASMLFVLFCSRLYSGNGRRTCEFVDLSAVVAGAVEDEGRSKASRPVPQSAVVTRWRRGHGEALQGRECNARDQPAPPHQVRGRLAIHPLPHEPSAEGTPTCAKASVGRRDERCLVFT